MSLNSSKVPLRLLIDSITTPCNSGSDHFIYIKNKVNTNK